MSFDVAPLDRYAARITTGVAYLGGLLMLPILFAYVSNMRWSGLLIPSAFALTLAIFLLMAYAFQPVAYKIEDGMLVIQRRWVRAIRISLDRITGVSAAPTLADMPRTGLRFAFNPGIFGYQGPFRLAPYGMAFFLATNRERLVAVARLADPPLILSPARPRDFIEALNSQRTKHALQEMTQTVETQS
jgi:hypothetical protein